jgi:hypothetical protein
MLIQTKKFINLRQPYAPNKLEIVTVKLVGGGKANDCSNNSLNLVEQDDDFRPITGWIVCASKDIDNFEVIQHWWNADKKGNHIDTTPAIAGVVEYVVDLDLYKFAYQNYDAIDSIVGSSLQIRNENIIAVDEELGVGRKRKYRTLTTLDNHSIFNL